MKLTYFPRHDMLGQPVEVDWETFAHDLGSRFQIIADKHDRPAIGPYTLSGPRLDENVTAYSLQCFDYERLTLDQLGIVYSKHRRYRGLIYSTWSNFTDKAFAVRVIHPLENTPHNHFKARKKIGRYVGISSDPTTHNPSRIFYLPCSRPGDPPPNFEIFTGPPLDPYTLPGERKVTGEDFEALLKSLQYKSRSADNPEKRQRINVARDAVKALLEGRPYAQEGAIDPALVSLIGYMKHAWGTDVDTDTIIQIMDRSLSTMPPDRAHAHARERIERLYAQAREEEYDHSEERIRQHFKRLNAPMRTEPYSQDELAYMRETFCDRDNFAYLVHASSNIYGITTQGYQDYGRADGMPDVIRALAPFSDINLITSTGAVQPVKYLLDNHGQHARSLEYSYLRSQSYFDGTTLTLAAATQRPIEPRYDPEVDAWIVALAGHRAPLLRSWLSLVSHLDRPLVALHLHGPPGTGKSLFAQAVARPWGVPTSMHHAFDNFNDDLLGSPIVLADEHFPTHKTNTNVYKTQEFRDIIQASTHKVHAKYKGLAILHGYVRCIVTTNNRHMFKLAHNTHSKDDIQAVHDRVLRIEVPASAREVTLRLGPESLANTDRLMAHALTLPRPTTVHRFGIEPQPLDYNLVIGIYIPARVLELIFALLATSALPAAGYQVREGQLYVAPGFVKLPSEKIKQAEIHDAISILSDDRDGQFYHIALTALTEYAASIGQPIKWLTERLAHHEHQQHKGAN